jgi:hypothetical protein
VGGRGRDQDQLLLQNNNGTASALYWLSTTQSSQAPSAADLQAVMFQNIGITVTKVLSLTQTAPQQEPTGQTQTVQFEEFLGTYKGAPLHGIATGGGVTSGVLRLGLSSTGLWEAVNGALIKMAGSIQHDFTQDEQTWEHITQQWQLQSQTFQDFDNAITGADLVTDPANGQPYLAPYNAFNAHGPSGPGYYDGKQKLAAASGW